MSWLHLQFGGQGVWHAGVPNRPLTREPRPQPGAVRRVAWRRNTPGSNVVGAKVSPTVPAAVARRRGAWHDVRVLGGACALSTTLLAGACVNLDRGQAPEFGTLLRRRELGAIDTAGAVDQAGISGPCADYALTVPPHD